MLRLFGAKVGKNVHVYPTTRITIPWNLDLGNDCAVGDFVVLYALGAIKIGERSTVSQFAHLCAGSHDWTDSAMPLTKPPIQIGADVWVCADVFVGPGVAVGDGAILGARTVAMKNCSANTIYSGNPARPVRSRA